MARKFILVFILSGCFLTYSQVRKPRKELGSDGLISNRLLKNDSTFLKGETKIELSDKTKFIDYKIFNVSYDTTYVDTTLTIEKYYKFNFIRKDNFELMPFHNQGQTFNKLAYNFNDFSLYPGLGAKAKFYNYYKLNDINYYKVATPTTELAWQTGMTQGQFLDALITVNLNENQNITLAYKGLRSQGKYRQALASQGNFRASYLFSSNNKRYNLRTHIAAQDLYNQENGGLTPESVAFFEEDNPDFKERGRLETNFQDAYNILRGNRYYLEHDYAVIVKKDTLKQLKNVLKIGNILKYNTIHYEFYQSSANNFFGEAFTNSIVDKNHLTTFYNEVSATLESPVILGRLKVMIANYKYNYRFNSIKYIQGQIIPQGINGNTTSFKANWKTYYKNIRINVDAGVNILGDLNGNYFKADGIYKKDSLFTLKASISNFSKKPDFNVILYQSDYKNYNWYNNNFNNEITQNLEFSFLSDKIINSSLQISRLDNYTFFTDVDSDNQIEPNQYSQTINYLKLRVSRKLKYKKFTLDNTILYQKVSNGDNVLNVPDFLFRNSLYFSDYMFKGNPLYLQTGFSVKYFTKYNMNGYNPLLSEFYVQNQTAIGDFPIIDYFINAKVRQTRLYFKFDNIGSVFLKKNYYSAPGYPYRDFVIRFGLVWNFFI